MDVKIDKPLSEVLGKSVFLSVVSRHGPIGPSLIRSHTFLPRIRSATAYCGSAVRQDSPVRTECCRDKQTLPEHKRCKAASKAADAFDNQERIAESVVAELKWPDDVECVEAESEIDRDGPLR